jgi:transposase-like protein
MALTKQVLQSALEAEMAHHLGYDDRQRRAPGTTPTAEPKTVTTEIGKFTVGVPHDREGSLELGWLSPSASDGAGAVGC